MVEHVFMVEGSGSSEILKNVIRYFQDDEFHFLIHWDKKSAHVDFSKFRNVTLIESIPVYWGTDSQVIVEKNLFFAAHEQFPNAKWFHLISESDVPLMNKKVFKAFFASSFGSDVEFDGRANEYIDRIKYYFPIRKLNFKDSKTGLFIHRLIKALNMGLRINRLSNFYSPVYKGSNWVSLTNGDLNKVVSFDNFEMFLHSSLGDEVYVQTILGDEYLNNFSIVEKEDDRYLNRNRRYIDWNRGNPYSFLVRDYAELVENINTKYTFVRKIKSVELSEKIVSLLERSENESIEE